MPSAGFSSQYNTPVVVNLDVQIDTSGNIVVFGEEAPTVQNIITASVNLPVCALYDASGASNGGFLNSLFEFWEPEEAGHLGERRATLSGKDASGIPLSNRDYTKMSKKFVCDLQAVLEGSFDCSGASPYNNQQYASTTIYNTQSDFGRLALSTYAHYLFGHVGATSAITNDQQFMDAMLSKINGVYKYTLASDVSGNSNGSQWISTGSSTDADLARQLVGSIITKNNDAILAIVNQVLGQDASRAMDQDNNALAPGVRHALKFIAGDTIFMNIKLITPSITVGNGQLVQDTTLQNKYIEETYTLKITLSDAEGFDFPTSSIPTIDRDTKGISEWATYFKGDTFGYGYSVSTDLSNNVYISGSYKSSTQVNIKNVSGNTQTDSNITLPTTSGIALFLIKYDASGVAQWATSLDGTNSDYGFSVSTDLSNNIYITGYYNSSTQVNIKNVSGNTQTNSDITLPTTSGIALFLIKYDASGIAQWATYLNCTGIGLSISIDSLNNIYITGKYISTTQVNIKNVSGNTQTDSDITLPITLYESMFIVKYDASGIVQWATCLNINNINSGQSISIDSLNNVYITGYYKSSTQVNIKNVSGNTQTNSDITLPTSSNNAVFLIKYDASGVAQWATSLDGTDNTNETGLSLTTDTNNNIYMLAAYNSIQPIIKDASGNTQTNSSITLPMTYSAKCIIKYDASGVAQWATYIDGVPISGYFYGYSILSDSFNNIYITGNYYLTDVKDASGNTQTNSYVTLPESITTTSVFLIKYNSSGIAQWATFLNGDSTDYGNSIAIDSNDKIYIAGSYFSTVPVNIQDASGNTQLTSGIVLPGNTPNGSAFLVKYG